MKKIFNKNNKGFTLVESLVAVGILSLSILATFTAVQKSLQYSSGSKDQTRAFFLAQEGVEFIKNIRDENNIHDISGDIRHWLGDIAENSNDHCYFGKTCIFDITDGSVYECPGGFGTCPYLREDPNTGILSYQSNWPVTRFRREIRLTSISAEEIMVTIRIDWPDRTQTKSLTVSQILFNR